MGLAGFVLLKWQKIDSSYLLKIYFFIKKQIFIEKFLKKLKKNIQKQN